MDELVPGIAFVARLLIGAVLIYAGVAKIRHANDFERSLRFYRGFGPLAQRLAVRGLPVLEIGLGAAMLSGLAQAPLAFMAAGLFVLFTILTIVSFGWRGKSDCGCFGRLTTTTVKAATVRNLSLAALALVSASAIWQINGLEVPLLAAVGAICLAVLTWPLADSLGEALANTGGQETSDPHRRRFLKLAAALVGAGGLLALTENLPVAEAACSSCGTCSDQFIFLNCTGGGCAIYWVRPRMACDAGCAVCGSWSVEEYCGIPGC